MEEKERGPIGKCYGSTTVGPRGQLVIPVDARREVGLEIGTRLLVFESFQGRGIALVRADAVEQLLKLVNERVSEFEKMLEEYTKSE
jgi:bifunctional DNA-binding transcriptional regulator/antitoxin component of YhaV-PrlF toxin-antitoxin module